MLIYIAIFILVCFSLALWVRNYLRNHCLECKKRTDWGKYDSCQECKASHEARIEQHKKEYEERIRTMIHESLKQVHADQKEFGYSDGDLLDMPCALCTDGAPKTHRKIVRERGFSGDHKKCWDFMFNTHFPLSRKARVERESLKFWKRWLYIPPSKSEVQAIACMRWRLQNILFEGCEDLARLREYKPYIEKPDHWIDMTTKQLLKRRFSRAIGALGLGDD